MAPGGASGQVSLVCLLNDVVCMSQSEYWVRGRLDNKFSSKDYMFIPDNTNLQKRNMISCEALVFTCDGRIPVRLLHTGDDERKIYKGTRLGWLIDVDYFACNIMSLSTDWKKENFYNSLSVNSGNSDDNMKGILWQYRDVFSLDENDIGCATIEHEINTGNRSPIALRSRRVPIAFEQAVDEKIDKMLEGGIIKRSNSPWNFPLVIVRKKNGDIRLCVDYRKLNDVTERPIFPIPDHKVIFDSLGGNKYFLCLDLSSGYHQVPMKENDKCKTAFTTRHGQFEFNRMPFGLSGAPATFQKIMHSVMQGELWEKCAIYLDDCIIFGKTPEEHNERLKTVLEKFREANLKLSPKKCTFFKNELVYLGHVINEYGIHTDPKNINY